ncbi:TPA: trypsin-like peptidase domain-containing protein [Streptococcus suis]
MKQFSKLSYLILSLFLLGQFSSMISAEELDSSTEVTSAISTASSDAATQTSSSSIEDSTEVPAVAEETSPQISLESSGNSESIIGTDDRYQVVDTTATPYQSVVMLRSVFSRTITYGTGVVIGKDTILTAAHNVYDVSKGVWASSIVAYPAKSGTIEPYGSYEAYDYYMFRAYQTNNGAAESDIAVIKLKTALDSSIGYLRPVTEVSVGESVQVPGYPYNRGYQMHTMFAPVTIVESDLIAYTVDTEGGQSGSPILNSQNQIVGIHILGNTDYNIGRRITDDVLELIQLAKSGKSGTADIANYTELTRKDTYRVYHPGIKRHLYTQNLSEVNYLSSIGWKNEGPNFKTVSTGTPVYRLYHSGTREHIYTTSTNERNILRTRGWRYEGVAWYSSGTKPIYRLYHPGLQVHLYTADKNESDTLRKRGWNYEGVAFYTLQ